jgi:polar amino acid transport system substrate-binding protein
MKQLKALAMAAVAVIAIGAGSSAARADLVFATDAAPYPPFTSQNAAGEWEGWEYDLLQAVCAEMNEKCTLIPVAWDGIIPSLLEKKFDGIFGSLSITPERQKQINFSDAYYNTASVLIGPKGGNKDISPEAMKGKTIGAQASTTHANYVEKYFVPAGATLKTYKGQDEANASMPYRLMELHWVISLPAQTAPAANFTALFRWTLKCWDRAQELVFARKTPRCLRRSTRRSGPLPAKASSTS